MVPDWIVIRYWSDTGMWQWFTLQHWFIEVTYLEYNSMNYSRFDIIIIMTFLYYVFQRLLYEWIRFCLHAHLCDLIMKAIYKFNDTWIRGMCNISVCGMKNTYHCKGGCKKTECVDYVFRYCATGNASNVFSNVLSRNIKIVFLFDKCEQDNKRPCATQSKKHVNIKLK